MAENQTTIEDLNDDNEASQDLSEKEAEKISGGGYRAPLSDGGGTTIDTIYSNGTTGPDTKAGD